MNHLLSLRTARRMASLAALALVAPGALSAAPALRPLFAFVRVPEGGDVLGLASIVWAGALWLRSRRRQR